MISGDEIMEKFGEEYYEKGVTNHISGYEDYHYMPTRSYEEAITISKVCDWHTILDYGCAKGYLVHALRQLGYDAHGYDISKYAIDNCYPRVKGYVANVTIRDNYEYIICKDVMEHIPEEEVLDTLKYIHNLLDIYGNALFVIPLGDDNKFRIREYEIDVTHVTKKNEDWWIDKLREAGFGIERFSYKMGNIKKKWQHYEYGNGFFEVYKV